MVRAWGWGVVSWGSLTVCAVLTVVSVSISLVDVTKKIKVSNPSSLLSIQTALDQATQYNRSLVDQLGQIDTFKDCKCRTDGTVFLNSFDLGTKERQSRVSCDTSTVTLQVFANDLDAHLPNISVSQGVAMGFLGNNNTSDDPPTTPHLYPSESATVNILTSDLKRGSWNSNVDVSAGTIQAQVVHASQLLNVSGRLSASVLYITKPEGGSAATFTKNNADCTWIEAMGPVSIVSPYVTAATQLCRNKGSYLSLQDDISHPSTAAWGWTDYSGPTAAPWTRKTSAGTYGTNTELWNESGASGPNNYGPSIAFYTSEANGGSFHQAVVPSPAKTDGDFFVTQWDLWFGSISFQAPSEVSQACKSKFKEIEISMMSFCPPDLRDLCLYLNGNPFPNQDQPVNVFINNVLEGFPTECDTLKSSRWPFTTALEFEARNYYPTVWAKWLVNTVDFGKAHRAPPAPSSGAPSLVQCGTSELSVGDKCTLSNGASYIWDGTSWKVQFYSECSGFSCAVPGMMCVPETTNPAEDTTYQIKPSMFLPTEFVRHNDRPVNAYIWWVCSLERKWTPLPYLPIRMESGLYK